MEICLEVRNIVAQLAPHATERIVKNRLTYHDAARGGPVKAGICGISLHDDHVRVHFVHEAFLQDPTGLLEGNRLAMRYLPTTYGLFVTVREAQEARGWIVNQGNFVRRARAHVPILVATIIASLRLSDSLGLALAARGLGHPAQRTSLHGLHFGSRDWLATALLTVILGGLIALRFATGFGATPW